jgi:UDP-hydrolysing UDP-N-acetyl-D-glucosamine 2-epimerase
MAGAPRTIAAVTSSRADYGHLFWPLRAMSERPEIDLRLLVTGAHLSNEFGRTVEVIERDGFPIAERVECLISSDSDVAMAKGIGVATIGFADALARSRPDLLLLIADRYEMLGPAAAALALRIPVVHIEGGEASEGAIDHMVRNALTMMSHVHLTPTPLARRRVIAMGEEPWRVHCTGAPSLDHLRRSRLPGRGELENGLSESENPAIPAPTPKTTRPRTNRDWWPNQLDLSVLHQHSPCPTRWTRTSTTRGVQVARRRGAEADLVEVMTTSQDWWPADYGHYGRSSSA